VLAREEVDRAQAQRSGTGDEPPQGPRCRRRPRTLDQARSQRKALADNAPSSPGLRYRSARGLSVATRRSSTALGAPHTILQIHAKAGETVAPSPDNVLFVRQSSRCGRAEI
jgi:hypothetical protein